MDKEKFLERYHDILKAYRSDEEKERMRCIIKLLIEYIGLHTYNKLFYAGVQAYKIGLDRGLVFRKFKKIEYYLPYSLGWDLAYKEAQRKIREASFNQ